MAKSTSDAKPNLAATSWALLGLMSYEQEVSGYDIRKWTEWTMRFFYGSPAYSQIYSELKKLERLGLLTSRVENTGGTRNRRLYKITPAGLDAVRRWANEAPVDPPVLKHSPLLRVTFGHLTKPERLKEILHEHVAYADAMQREAAKDAKWAGVESSWAYAKIALQWAERYYASERELALKMLKELDEAEAAFADAGIESGDQIPWPTPEYWYEIEKKAEADD
ncbi:PadR family transcriptional regulator [Mycolicibacterium novocastrense]|uniref:PadR family transcriptional regulator n=1 Tax=Mycolicibacterium novocastrense TaxID=59813 RepID=A0AAW5SMN7_MYCNV|nr:PadR family transcriptional regulator [Mycolicibacterium novocastrense]KUH71999.1 PadR family transcriptional regulator [Mycolicibacterium novocastrense]KUH72171.1 PadR family transcriptional regulator [Mycolicibacterium novocastrense]KUH73122.1 PadR family transcriptional regulator [Mycolicibacterium novocastrense]MCV7025039.1 PadR family transcriptional regulator [Mycolicibacterium novocastrense]UUO00431.1 PadR family transcriptional regulator [Mycolicibacterium novocastrense]